MITNQKLEKFFQHYLFAYVEGRISVATYYAVKHFVEEKWD